MSVMMKYLVWPIINLIRTVTLSREFGKCSAADFKNAAVELVIASAFATMPIWLFPIFGKFIFVTDRSTMSLMRSYFSDGELIIYAAALMGPLFFIISRRYGQIDRTRSRFGVAVEFPHGIAFVIAAALICVIGGFSIGLIRNPIFPAKESGIPIFNSEGILWLSIVLYFVALYVTFCASAYRNAMESELSVAKDPPEEDDFSRDWQRRSDGG